MAEKNVYTVGETVYDIVFRDGQPVSATAGGAMLNTSVSLGRLGLPVRLVSELGEDAVGDLIMDFLNTNGVGTDLVTRYSGKTAVALAFLDENDDASYSFYKDYPADRKGLHAIQFQPGDLLLFGSFFAMTKEVREPLLRILKDARTAGATIIYDPNFRESHRSMLPGLKDYLFENLDYADVVRGSHADFRHIFNARSPDEAYRAMAEAGDKILIHTEGGRPVSFRSGSQSFAIDVPPVDPVSTIGAGDSFNAGIIYGLSKLKVDREQLFTLKRELWRTILETAATFGAVVCETYENYIPAAFARKLRKHR